MDDKEVLAIIKDLLAVNYKTDEEGNELVYKINQVYPGISDLLYWDDRNLTAEQILDEAKSKKLT
jgi:hypothetical protein